jgi:hypothetical protein
MIVRNRKNKSPDQNHDHVTPNKYKNESATESDKQLINDWLETMVLFTKISTFKYIKNITPDQRKKSTKNDHATRKSLEHFDWVWVLGLIVL